MYVIIKTLAFGQKTVAKFEQNINILKYFKTYSADLPNRTKYLGCLKKKFSLGVRSPWFKGMSCRNYSGRSDNYTMWAQKREFPAMPTGVLAVGGAQCVNLRIYFSRTLNVTKAKTI